MQTWVWHTHIYIHTDTITKHKSAGSVSQTICSSNNNLVPQALCSTPLLQLLCAHTLSLQLSLLRTLHSAAPHFFLSPHPSFHYLFQPPPLTPFLLHTGLVPVFSPSHRQIGLVLMASESAIMRSLEERGVTYSEERRAAEEMRGVGGWSPSWPGSDSTPQERFTPPISSVQYCSPSHPPAHQPSTITVH